MPAVFIHGVPDTYHVWDKVKAHVSRTDITTLALPGFNTPVPESFAATKEAYVAWIIAELERIGSPVDLVGHDWGCIFTGRVVSLRPDLIHTWAAGSGPISKEYEWHPLAKIWQTPDKGEAWFRDLKPEEFVQFTMKAGLSEKSARDAVSRIDSTMGDCILRLYRSAIDVGAEWQGALHNISRPGLVFWGQRDSACPVQFADQLAKDTNAQKVIKLDSDHWTIIERSAEVAAALEQHWAQ